MNNRFVDNGYHEPDDATVQMANNPGDFTSDFLALLELQGELLRVDGKVALSRSFISGGMTVFSIGLLLGACPLALLGPTR